MPIQVIAHANLPLTHLAFRGLCSISIPFLLQKLKAMVVPHLLRQAGIGSELVSTTQLSMDCIIQADTPEIASGYQTSILIQGLKQAGKTQFA